MGIITNTRRTTGPANTLRRRTRAAATARIVILLVLVAGLASPAWAQDSTPESGDALPVVTAPVEPDLLEATDPPLPTEAPSTATASMPAARSTEPPATLPTEPPSDAASAPFRAGDAPQAAIACLGGSTSPLMQAWQQHRAANRGEGSSQRAAQAGPCDPTPSPDLSLYATIISYSCNRLELETNSSVFLSISYGDGHGQNYASFGDTHPTFRWNLPPTFAGTLRISVYVLNSDMSLGRVLASVTVPDCYGPQVTPPPTATPTPVPGAVVSQATCTSISYSTTTGLIAFVTISGPGGFSLNFLSYSGQSWSLPAGFNGTIHYRITAGTDTTDIWAEGDVPNCVGPAATATATIAPTTALAPTLALNGVAGSVSVPVGATVIVATESWAQFYVYSDSSCSIVFPSNPYQGPGLAFIYTVPTTVYFQAFNPTSPTARSRCLGASWTAVVSTSTAQPTATMVPPTATIQPSTTPSIPATSIATATETPGMTPSATPPATATPTTVPPTVTATSVPPTATQTVEYSPTATPTATSRPSFTPTDAPPTATMIATLETPATSQATATMTSTTPTLAPSATASPAAPGTATATQNPSPSPSATATATATDEPTGTAPATTLATGTIAATASATATTTTAVVDPSPTITPTQPGPTHATTPTSPVTGLPDTGSGPASGPAPGIFLLGVACIAALASAIAVGSSGARTRRR